MLRLTALSGTLGILILMLSSLVTIQIGEDQKPQLVFSSDIEPTTNLDTVQIKIRIPSKTQSLKTDSILVINGELGNVNENIIPEKIIQWIGVDFPLFHEWIDDMDVTQSGRLILSNGTFLQAIDNFTNRINFFDVHEESISIQNISISKQDSIYVLLEGNDVVVFDKELAEVRRFDISFSGSCGSSVIGFVVNEDGVAVENGVAGGTSCKNFIHVFDLNGNLIDTFNKPGAGRLLSADNNQFWMMVDGRKLFKLDTAGNFQEVFLDKQPEGGWIEDIVVSYETNDLYVNFTTDIAFETYVYDYEGKFRYSYSRSQRDDRYSMDSEGSIYSFDYGTGQALKVLSPRELEYEIDLIPQGIGEVKLKVLEGAVSDYAGNLSELSEYSFFYDNVEPSGYSLFLESSKICVNDTLKFTISNAEPGGSYTYDIISGSLDTAFSGSVSSAELSFEYLNLPPGKGVVSFVHYDSVGNAGQKMDHEFVKSFEPSAPELCFISIDRESNMNKLHWSYAFSSVQDIAIYKEGSITDEFELLDIVRVDPQTQEYTYLDSISDPTVSSSRYRLVAIDTCGYSSLGGQIHKTLHLTINAAQNGAWNLIWQPYEGIDISTYRILRGTRPDSLVLLDEVAGSISSYTDNNPPNGDVYYQIEFVVETNCTGEGTETIQSSRIASLLTVRSNIARFEVLLSTAEIEKMQVFPNPVSELLFLKNVPLGMTYKVFSISGKVIYSGKYLDVGIHVRDLDSGTYIIQYNNRTGKFIRCY